MTKEELTQYITELCQQKGYDEAQTKKAVALATGDDEIAKVLGPIIDLPLGRQAAFSKEMNGLKEKHKELDTWHKGAKAAFDSDKQTKTQLELQVQAFRTKFGELPADGDPAKPKPVSEKSTAELLDERDQYHLRMQADLGRVRAQHARMFKGEIIDDSELLMAIGKAASENRHITVQEAYTGLHGERIKTEETRIATERDEKLRQEGVMAERKRLSAAGMKTGAAVSERSTALFSAIDSEGKKDDPLRKKSADESIDDFAADLEQQFSKLEQAAT